MVYFIKKKKKIQVHPNNSFLIVSKMEIFGAAFILQLYALRFSVSIALHFGALN